MTDKQKEKITRVSKEFASGFEPYIFINGSGWLIVDPLSAYLAAVERIKCTIQEIPAKDNHPQVLIMTFKDGTKFIPAGADLKPINEAFNNWMWIDTK